MNTSWETRLGRESFCHVAGAGRFLNQPDPDFLPFMKSKPYLTDDELALLKTLRKGPLKSDSSVDDQDDPDPPYNSVTTDE